MNKELSDTCAPVILPAVKALVDGLELNELPKDLFIPPDALEILLETFSGPLDLLLYLIRKQNIDILNIPMVSITQQYLNYIHLMQFSNLELAAEYLLMAALLTEIKSKLLLPLPVSSEDQNEEEEDPRLLLVRKLQAYEQIKQAAEQLDALPRKERDNFVVQIEPICQEKTRVYPEVNLTDLIKVMQDLFKKKDQLSQHEISRELMSVKDKMVFVLLKLQPNEVLEFHRLIMIKEGRLGLIVTFLAILELARQSLLKITQTQDFSPIYLQAV